MPTAAVSASTPPPERLATSKAARNYFYAISWPLYVAEEPTARHEPSTPWTSHWNDAEKRQNHLGKPGRSQTMPPPLKQSRLLSRPAMPRKRLDMELSLPAPFSCEVMSRAVGQRVLSRHASFDLSELRKRGQQPKSSVIDAFRFRLTAHLA